MKFAKTLPVLIFAWLLGISAWSQDANERRPYAGIVARNAFELQPITTTAPPIEPALVLPKITPNGTHSLFGKMQVLFTVASKDESGKPKMEAFVLGEGQTESGIEVIQIREKEGVIIFSNHGIIQQLALGLQDESATGARRNR